MVESLDANELFISQIGQSGVLDRARYRRQIGRTAKAATHEAAKSVKRAPAAARPRAHHDSSPLVTTVTRIINVVPALVWIVMAALAALALALGTSSRVVALKARRLARQRKQLLEDVGLLQAALLPSLPGRLGPVGTSAAYRPASGPAAGGDFYDVFALEGGQVAVIIGDVSGHGREALPHTLPRGIEGLRLGFGWASPRGNESADALVTRAPTRLLVELLGGLG